MKPFVLLATRAEDVPADEEYELFLRYTGLAPKELQRVRLEADHMPAIDLDAISGIFLGGGPFNSSDAESEKSVVQRRVESEIATLLKRVVALDFPFLGACYGVGTLGSQQGAVIDRHFAEPISVVDIALSDAGERDPLCAALPPSFSAFVGHKEAIRRLPETATLLASSATCPVQMFRVGENVYATQFHPELDVVGITTRIRAYASYGYFGLDEIDMTLAAVNRAPVTHPTALLSAFVARYAL
ncbi:GMP synthase (glutamine-hydrolyzing) [Microbacterium halimionae]|uniref:GMP synthase (Glutamine-hydrolyzing) n=1 Tax=Microbacterium halimionae TaxID=1526413 RepID=A0A7W3PLV7_9MICO|nr:glutamine amidotransferase [Microbacterium halimionae]MBA8816342.1 GMP synthase (glutamine-hydrolyzing) [Microbacterium halimionae]NII96544.1 GMP synthase (glutamine-hydrolysing) [Microbacterium halimionae]